MHHRRKQRGFSLVELSISLVVIALLIAAVTQGSSLLRSARMKTILSEINEKQVWINSFRTVYSELPGDFEFAENYWGASNTDNGDNNAEISYKNASNVYEGFKAWQHLTFADIADKKFDGGPANPATTAPIPGTNIPASIVNGAGYMIDYGIFTHSSKNVLVLGKPVKGASLTVDGALKPNEGLLLDSKSDDGDPTTGAMRAEDGNSSSANSCVTASNIYSQTNEGRDCTLGIRLSTD